MGETVLVKILLGHYVKRGGVKVISDFLINSVADVTLDSIISAHCAVHSASEQQG